jgi:hypothetical protein
MKKILNKKMYALCIMSMLVQQAHSVQPSYYKGSAYLGDSESGSTGSSKKNVGINTDPVKMEDVATNTDLDFAGASDENFEFNADSSKKSTTASETGAQDQLETTPNFSSERGSSGSSGSLDLDMSFGVHKNREEGFNNMFASPILPYQKTTVESTLIQHSPNMLDIPETPHQNLNQIDKQRRLQSAKKYLEKAKEVIAKKQMAGQVIKNKATEERQDANLYLNANSEMYTDPDIIIPEWKPLGIPLENSNPEDPAVRAGLDKAKVKGAQKKKMYDEAAKKRKGNIEINNKGKKIITGLTKLEQLAAEKAKRMKERKEMASAAQQALNDANGLL